MKVVAEAVNRQDRKILIAPAGCDPDGCPDAFLNGIEATIGTRSEFPNARIIVLTTYAGDVQVLQAIKAGARGYVLKGHVIRELLDTIRAVHAGQKRIPGELAELADHAGTTS